MKIRIELNVPSEKKATEVLKGLNYRIHAYVALARAKGENSTHIQNDYALVTITDIKP